MRQRLLITIGHTYERLTVLKAVKSNVFECECDCGQITTANSVQLFRGKKKSCGCQKIDSARNLCIKKNTTHGQSKTKEYKKESDKKYREKHYDELVQKKREANQRLKLIVMQSYSNGDAKCLFCPQNDIRCLNLDHIKGGGRKHQRQVGNVYQYLKNNNFPPGFQILCQNCNWLKMLRNREIKQNGDKNTERYRLCNQKLHANVISAYSNSFNQCVKCKCNDMRVLCIDHINGGGCSERKKLYNDNAMKWWRHLRDNNYPTGYQVLCQNCNRIKMYEQKEWNSK